ncbi:MAG: hypothetical protein LBM62_04635, partial [Mediterranea sp.]|nr:hypothetical protein [Mediterranea sp.]
MKHIVLVSVFLSISILFFSCTHENATLSPKLKQVESIMYAYPDSALQLLEHMSVSEIKDPLNHATWCLFMTQAIFKNYVEQSDSLLNIAYSYFMKQDNLQRKALALYLKGGFHEERKESEIAVNYLTQASEWADKTSDYRLSSLIWAHLGSIYTFSNLAYAEDAL